MKLLKASFVNSAENEKPVCLITGGTSGVGRAAVQIFRDNGYRIATCGRDEERLNRLRDDFSADSRDCFIEQVDLAEVDQTRKFFEAVIAKLGRVDVLVNNAATAPLAKLEDINETTFEKMINVNIRSVFYLTQLAWKQMKEQGRGVIVNMSSLAAVDPFPGFSIYGASKAWLDIMTHALASEGKEYGIRIFSIRAGAIETPLLRNLFPDFPADQCVSPEEVAMQIWRCVSQPDQHVSGTSSVVANQK